MQDNSVDISSHAVDLAQPGRRLMAAGLGAFFRPTRLAAFLDREMARIDSLVAEVREAIGRLKELRIALVSAAVSGKIDVREEVA